MHESPVLYLPCHWMRFLPSDGASLSMISPSSWSPSPSPNSLPAHQATSSSTWFSPLTKSRSLSDSSAYNHHHQHRLLLFFLLLLPFSSFFFPNFTWERENQNFTLAHGYQRLKVSSDPFHLSCRQTEFPFLLGTWENMQPPSWTGTPNWCQNWI